MEPRSQRWLKTSTISRPRRESCSGSLSSRLSSRASIGSWTRAAAVLTPHRHSPLAGGQARPQGRVGLAGAAGAYGDDVVTARGEPRETHPLRAPRAGLTAPQGSRTSLNHREAGKKRVLGSESKTGISQAGPSRRSGRDRRGATGRGEPGEKHPLRALCRPDGPAALPDVQNHREGGKTPVRASESEAGTSRQAPGKVSRQGSARRHRQGRAHGEKHPSCAPRAGLTAPQRSVPIRR